MPIMYSLSRRKLRLAEALRSRALRTDAVESITCDWLSPVVVVGLVGQLLIGSWWVVSATSFGIVWFLVREGRRRAKTTRAATITEVMGKPDPTPRRCWVTKSHKLVRPLRGPVPASMVLPCAGCFDRASPSA